MDELVVLLLLALTLTVHTPVSHHLTNLVLTRLSVNRLMIVITSETSAKETLALVAAI